jgi:hypothetical protein
MGYSKNQMIAIEDREGSLDDFLRERQADEGLGSSISPNENLKEF